MAAVSNPAHAGFPLFGHYVSDVAHQVVTRLKVLIMCAGFKSSSLKFLILVFNFIFTALESEVAALDESLQEKMKTLQVLASYKVRLSYTGTLSLVSWPLLELFNMFSYAGTLLHVILCWNSSTW